jgi:hypothetical protein
VNYGRPGKKTQKKYRNDEMKILNSKGLKIQEIDSLFFISTIKSLRRKNKKGKSIPDFKLVSGFDAMVYLISNL